MCNVCGTLVFQVYVEGLIQAANEQPLVDMVPHVAIQLRTCPYCPRVFTTPTWKQKLDRHIRMHIGDKPFQCPHCAHKSNRKDNLRMHIDKMHKGDIILKTFL